MKRKVIQFGVGFRVALGNPCSQATVMVLKPGDSEGGPTNRHRGADQWWAPRASRVEVVFDDSETLNLEPCEGGDFIGTDRHHGVGSRYRIRLDGRGPYPDPCSRFQPDGPHEASQVVDPQGHDWRDVHWPGVCMKGQVCYELHIGTFTPAGTFDAAIERLDALAMLGVTLLELMPVAEFPGRWNWGYDGVQLYAPYHGYGDYDSLKRFIDAAHSRGLGVILDVVYNHLGPDGNYLPAFTPDYFTDRYRNDWSEAINFDGPNAAGVRRFFIDNARYWIEEFHFDGLRLDATQSIFDASPRHILLDIVEEARRAAGTRHIVLIGENEPQRSDWLLPAEAGGFGLDALWNDDFHHSARVALTGAHDGYLHDYRGRAQEFISAAKRGFLYQGQYYAWQKQSRGTPVTGQPAWSFVNFIQNHDQVANTLDGRRLPHLAAPARIRAMTALLLLSPQTPLLFMGQEFGSAQPFTFFADHHDELRTAVHAGRRAFVAQFAPYATPEAQASVPDPGDPRTFEACRLDLQEATVASPHYRLHRDLLHLRRNDPVIAAQDRQVLDGAVLAEFALALRWFGTTGNNRLLLVNLGSALDLPSIPEPLIAPPRGERWQVKWCSERPAYGGTGCIDPFSNGGCALASDIAVLFESIAADAKGGSHE